LGDLGGGTALEGEDDGPEADPSPFPGDGLCEVLEFVEGVVVADVHGGGSWWDPEVRLILPN
jgi:hypothetical protein